MKRYRTKKMKTSGNGVPEASVNRLAVLPLCQNGDWLCNMFYKRSFTSINIHSAKESVKRFLLKKLKNFAEFVNCNIFVT